MKSLMYGQHYPSQDWKLSSIKVSQLDSIGVNWYGVKIQTQNYIKYALVLGLWDVSVDQIHWNDR